MPKVTRLAATPSDFFVKKRVAAYARVSTQTERMQHSLYAQVSHYSHLIQANPSWSFAGVYADEGVTGTLAAKRTGFMRMLADCQAGKIDLILTKSLSRFARNTVDLLNAVRHLRQIGVEVRFEKENISTFDGKGEILLTLLASFAQEESRSISANIRWGIQKKFSCGQPGARFRVYGYRWEGDAMVIVPEEANIVQRIYGSIIAGSSQAETARALDRDGIKPARGSRWNRSSINRIVKNEIYCGSLLLQKHFVADAISKNVKRNSGERASYLIENHHEAIISKAIFCRAQEAISMRNAMRRTKKCQG